MIVAFPPLRLYDLMARCFSIKEISQLPLTYTENIYLLSAVSTSDLHTFVACGIIIIIIIIICGVGLSP
jgi:hypothetical protein